MTSRKGRETWAGELPVEVLTELRSKAKEDGVPQWKVVSQALRLYLGIDEGSTETALERQVQEARDELESIRDQRSELESAESNLEDRIDGLSEKLEEIREKKADYREQLDAILETMEENPNQTVMASMEAIREAARDEYGRNSSDNIDRVIADLRDRRDELDLTDYIPDHRFRRSARYIGEESAPTDGGVDRPQLRLLSDDADSDGGESE